MSPHAQHTVLFHTHIHGVATYGCLFALTSVDCDELQAPFYC